MKPLTLEMSDPLTLGMGHPVTERIRRLSMRKTNLLTRSGSCALIVAALGLTAPVFTATATSPVTEIVDSLAKRAVDTLGDVTPSSTELPSTNQPQKQVQLMASNAPLTAAKTPGNSGLKPMRLRITMTRQLTPEQILKINAYRKAIAGGDETAKKDMDAYFKAFYKVNRIQMTIKNDGQAVLDISKGAGGWPGYPIGNTDWDKRPLSAEMKNATRKITQRCSQAKSPVYYQVDISDGYAELRNGIYEVECVPGSEAVQKNTKEMDLAFAYLASDDLPLTRRQSSFQWKMGIAMMQEYVRASPNATIASDRIECVRILTLRKEKYAFTEVQREGKGFDLQLQRCATSDYNWVRKRMGIATVN